MNDTLPGPNPGSATRENSPTLAASEGLSDAQVDAQLDTQLDAQLDAQEAQDLTDSLVAEASAESAKDTAEDQLQTLEQLQAPKLQTRGQTEAHPEQSYSVLTAGQTVLVIDDSQYIHDLIAVRLRPEGLRMLHALDAEPGLALARQERPDLLLLDLDLPGQNGLELCRRFKDDPELSAIQVIFLTGTVDVATKVLAFDAGASDYITKPFDGVELRARVRSALRTKRLLDLLSTRAQLDGLTGLWNRAYFDARLSEECELARRHKRSVALIMLDVDHFKHLNDSYGHPFGDAVLIRLARVLVASTRRSEVACRYGGEEFAIILRETSLSGARGVAERVRAAIAAEVFSPRGEPLHISASLGVSAAEAEDADPASLTAAADAALYEAKRSGRNRVC